MSILSSQAQKSSRVTFQKATMPRSGSAKIRKIGSSDCSCGPPANVGAASPSRSARAASRLIGNRWARVRIARVLLRGHGRRRDPSANRAARRPWAALGLSPRTSSRSRRRDIAAEHPPALCDVSRTGLGTSRLRAVESCARTYVIIVPRPLTSIGSRSSNAYRSRRSRRWTGRPARAPASRPTACGMRCSRCRPTGRTGSAADR